MRKGECQGSRLAAHGGSAVGGQVARSPWLPQGPPAHHDMPHVQFRKQTVCAPPQAHLQAQVAGRRGAHALQLARQRHALLPGGAAGVQAMHGWLPGLRGRG